MDANARGREKTAGESAKAPLETAPALNPLFGDAETVRRSEENILKWMAYLPEDCINRMIEMEWDITT